MALLFLGCSAGGFFHMVRQPLGERLCFYEGGAGNAVSVAHGRELLLVDTKMWGYAGQLQRAVEAPPDGTLHQVKRILLTHAHADHAGGVDRFTHAGAVLLHTQALKRLRESGKASAVPYVEVTDAVSLRLDGEEVRIFHPGVAHTDGDLVALLPARGVLVAGDVLCAGLEPSADVTFGGQLRPLRRALERLLEEKFDTVLGGHGPATTRAEVEAKRDYLAALERAAVDARAKGLAGEAAERYALAALKEFAPYEPIPLRASRESNARQMLLELTQEQAP
ncbi:MAG: MBL fold metallo-hydrolase [Deltaproteobacteria bacterium]|nr:MBL fold metallo-hydrolase [Deltaproteobacteria bacterium]